MLGTLVLVGLLVTVLLLFSGGGAPELRVTIGAESVSQSVGRSGGGKWECLKPASYKYLVLLQY